MDNADYWIEVTPEMRKKNGISPEVVRIPRLLFDIGIPGTLNYKIARGLANPSDYTPLKKTLSHEKRASINIQQNNDFGYRELLECDVEGIFWLGKEHFGSPSEYSWNWSTSKIREYLNQDFGTGIVCADKREVLGFVLAQNRYSEQKPDVAWLQYIMTHPNHQSRGIGKTLFEKMITELKRKGAKEILADVYENNTESLHFFENQSFDIKERWFILARKI